MCTCQVNQTQLAMADGPIRPVLPHSEHYQAVGAAAGGVHASPGDCALGNALLHEIHQLALCLHRHLCKAKEFSSSLTTITTMPCASTVVKLPACMFNISGCRNLGGLLCFHARHASVG